MNKTIQDWNQYHDKFYGRRETTEYRDIKPSEIEQLIDGVSEDVWYMNAVLWDHNLQGIKGCTQVTCLTPERTKNLLKSYTFSQEDMQNSVFKYAAKTAVIDQKRYVEIVRLNSKGYVMNALSIDMPAQLEKVI